MSPVYYSSVDSPLGILLLAGDGEALHRILFAGPAGPAEPDPSWLRRNAVFTEVKKQLRAYFAGELRQFNLTLAPRGSCFQRQVWRAMQDIPYGQTRSYGEIARQLTRPAASRAVGAASGRNPLPLVIPCHRVIGGDGSLTGFGGGLKNKQWLLQLEQASLPFSLESMG